jgi:hypothetical protein
MKSTTATEVTKKLIQPTETKKKIGRCSTRKKN